MATEINKIAEQLEKMINNKDLVLYEQEMNAWYWLQEAKSIGVQKAIEKFCNKLSEVEYENNDENTGEHDDAGNRD